MQRYRSIGEIMRYLEGIGYKEIKIQVTLVEEVIKFSGVKYCRRRYCTIPLMIVRDRQKESNRVILGFRHVHVEQLEKDLNKDIPQELKDCMICMLTVLKRAEEALSYFGLEVVVR